MSAALPAALAEALVFDLDGTLIDSRRDIATAVNQVRGELGLPPLALAEVVAMVGEGARVLVARFLGPGATPEQVERTLPRYLAVYEEVCLDTTAPYPGIRELLAALGRSYPQAVLSNKGEALSRKILGHLGLAPFFREILGGDSLPVRKPDPAGLRELAARLGAPPERLLLVGDSRVDAETARAAGCRFALVEWGFPRPPDLEGIEADLRCATPGDLISALGPIQPNDSAQRPFPRGGGGLGPGEGQDGGGLN